MGSDHPVRRHGLRRLALVVALLGVLAGCAQPTPTPTSARPSPIPTSASSPVAILLVPSHTTESKSGLPTIDGAALPDEVHQTLLSIGTGGPYPFPQDGVVFESREGILLDAPGGYYHEYAVVTPRSADRGARRVVVGNQGEAYRTDDHYTKFSRIAP